MALINEAQEIGWEIINERIGRLTWLTTIKMARIVFNTRTKSHGLNHLKIIGCAHFQTLRFKKLSLFIELGKTILQFILNGLNRALQRRTRSNVMRSRPNGQRFEGIQHFTGDIVDLRDFLDLVAPEFHANRIVRIGRKHIERIATHAERTALQFVIIAVILNVDELSNKLVAILLDLFIQEHRHTRIIHRRTNTIDAGNRGNNDYITTGKKLGGCCMTQFLHFLINGGILFDKGIRGRHIRFRLIVIVVTDKIHHRIVWEKFLQLGSQLRRKRFIGSQHKGWLLHSLNGFSHGVGFARTRHAQQGLITHTRFDIPGKLFNGLGLVACRLVRRDNFEWLCGKTGNRKLALHNVTLKIRKMAH